jgi:F0F1-type ATP synthase assembly protein I
VSEKKKGNPVLTVVLVTPLVIAPLVLLGVYLGFYLGDALGYSKAILAIVFSTIGFLVAIAILVKVITILVARSSWAKQEPSSARLTSPLRPLL